MTECRTRKYTGRGLPVVDLCKESAKYHFFVGGAKQVMCSCFNGPRRGLVVYVAVNLVQTKYNS